MTQPEAISCDCSGFVTPKGTDVCKCLRRAEDLPRRASPKEVRGAVDCLLEAADWLFPYVPEVRPRYSDRAAVERELDGYRVAPNNELTSTVVAKLIGIVRWFCREVSKQEIGPIVYDLPDSPDKVVKKKVI